MTEKPPRSEEDQVLLGRLKWFLQETKSCNPHERSMDKLIAEIGWDVKSIPIWSPDPDLI